VLILSVCIFFITPIPLFHVFPCNSQPSFFPRGAGVKVSVFLYFPSRFRSSSRPRSATLLFSPPPDEVVTLSGTLVEFPKRLRFLRCFPSSRICNDFLSLRISHRSRAVPPLCLTQGPADPGKILSGPCLPFPPTPFFRRPFRILRLLLVFRTRSRLLSFLSILPGFRLPLHG